MCFCFFLLKGIYVMSVFREIMKDYWWEFFYWEFFFYFLGEINDNKGNIC